MNYKTILIVSLLVIAVVLTANLYFGPFGSRNEPPTPMTFEECVAAGNPVQESAPRQCRTDDGTVVTEVLPVEPEPPTIEPTLSQIEAAALAASSTACTDVGTVGLFEVYNPNSGTWWFALEADQPGCAPACVIFDATRTAEVNWRCTGLTAQ